MLVVYVLSIYRDTLPTTLLTTPDTSQSCFEFFFSLKFIFFNSIYWQGFFFFFFLVLSFAFFWEFSFICRHQRQRNTETLHTMHARMPRSHHYTYAPAPARSPARAACIYSHGIGRPLPTARTVPRPVPSGPAYITPDQLFILLSQGKGRRVALSPLLPPSF